MQDEPIICGAKPDGLLIKAFFVFFFLGFLFLQKKKRKKKNPKDDKIKKGHVFGFAM